MPVLQVCDGLCLNDLEKWISMDFGYLILDFLDFRCETLNKFNLTGSVLHIFQTTTKWRAQLKLLQNEGARPPVEALFPEARNSLECFALQAGP